ncbi:MAG: YkgJ family cysteine cluster protein [Nannocystaceae bacterium]|nr:YkgJ family cysteine cluster protein [Nannocystaceae bacterium]
MLGLLGALFGPRVRLPRDNVTRLPRSARKAAKAEIAALQSALDKISALPGVADIKANGRVPRGFYDAVDEMHAAYDAYAAIVRKFLSVDQDAKQPGQPGGTAACYAGPMPVHQVEALAIYRATRSWRDFQSVAKDMGELGELLFNEIQSGHTGKDPEKIRMTGKAVQNGRIALAKNMRPCPFLDEGKQRCRIWEHRPIACRMHYPNGGGDAHRPDNEGYPKQAKAINIRLPVKQQVTMQQLDKRLLLELSPFMYAAMLQMLQLADGSLVQEVGEAPIKMQQDGRVSQRANRNVRHAKKFQKRPKTSKKKRK